MQLKEKIGIGVIVFGMFVVGTNAIYSVRKELYTLAKEQAEEKLVKEKEKQMVAFGDMYVPVERIASIKCKIEEEHTFLSGWSTKVDTNKAEYTIKIDRSEVDVVLRDVKTKARSAKIVFKDGSPVIRTDRWETPTKCTREIAESLKACIEGDSDFDLKKFSQRPKVVAEELQEELQKAEQWKDSGVEVDAGVRKKLTGKDVDDLLSWKNGIVVNKDGVVDWVTGLADEVDTKKEVWKFKTVTGKKVKVPTGTLGNKLNVNETAKRITNALKHDKHSVKAVWEQKCLGVSGDGAKIGDTYVEVSIQKQKLWYVEHGRVKLKSDVVTGLPTVERHTKIGAHQLLYKQKDRILRGSARSYSSHVDYWMPFTLDGQGLHDADWRGSFGGRIYKTNGSHGCVNMPDAKAKKLYEMLVVGTPIIVY